MQLLAFAIYSTQQDVKTEFRKAAFEKIFNLDPYLFLDRELLKNHLYLTLI